MLETLSLETSPPEKDERLLPETPLQSITRRLLYDHLNLSAFECFSFINENFDLLLDPFFPTPKRNYLEIKCVACFEKLRTSEEEGADLLLELLERRFNLLEENRGI